jgi:hypothetical protein
LRAEYLGDETGGDPGWRRRKHARERCCGRGDGGRADGSRRWRVRRGSPAGRRSGTVPIFHYDLQMLDLLPFGSVTNSALHILAKGIRELFMSSSLLPVSPLALMTPCDASLDI